jgi:hypothetical protein
MTWMTKNRLKVIWPWDWTSLQEAGQEVADHRNFIHDLDATVVAQKARWSHGSR